MPEGFNFLELIWKQEDKCENATDKRILRLGEKAPACLEQIGTVLSLMDRMASCWWVCKGGDHKVERLFGKVASNARGALRLLKFGFYDESLTLCRAMGEIANLLYLFVFDNDALAEWRTDDQDKLPPVKVRRKIEKLNKIVPVNQQRYRQLSKRVHVNPNTSPQSYNLLEIPTLSPLRKVEFTY